MTSQAEERKPFHHPRVRPDWLAKLTEEILDPGSAHHRPASPSVEGRPDPYLLADLVADLRTGHNVRATVFIQCHSEYRKDGPEEMQPVGETEFVAAAARASKAPNTAACGPVPASSATPTACWATRIDAVLEAHIQAGGGRFKGIRHSGTYDAGIAPTVPPGRAARTVPRSGVPRRIRPPAAAGYDVRSLAVSSATGRSGGSAARLSGTEGRAQSFRRPTGRRALRRAEAPRSLPSGAPT